MTDPDFRSGLARIANAQNRSMDQTFRMAERYLKEIAARPSQRMVNLAAVLGRILYQRAYDTVHCKRDELAALHRLSVRHPIVFLPCHRSNLDRPVMHRLLWENNLGPNYTAGGINMDFFPIGPISRRAGVFFIRRSFTNNPVYKFVLQAYFAYLVERRLPLEWYIEGGRSRTGKLRLPRYGLLGYAADALAAGKSDDIYLIPTSITYDHILELGAYTAEETGVTKEKETFRWLIRSVRSLRKRYGDIHVRFGEPLSMRVMIDPDRKGPERKQDLQRLASAVCIRINRVTPVTPSSLVAVALLAGPRKGLGRSELEESVAELVHEVESRNLPSTETPSRLRTRRGLEEEVGAFAKLGIVAVENEAQEPVYRIIEEQRLAACYYRNTIVHFFLTRAVAEVALAAVSRDVPSDPFQVFRECVAELSELLAFEFFLPDQDTLIGEIADELGRGRVNWMDRIAERESTEILEELRPHCAPWVLRSFLEAYMVVAEGLIELPAEQPWNKKSFLRTCLDRGTRYVSERRISVEASSLSLFSNGVRVAGRRALLTAGLDHLLSRRIAFASRLKLLVELVDILESEISGEEKGKTGYRHRVPS